ncbi:MAG: hypothetical protein AAF513_11335 [Pseudomonadota bacterium]
MKFLAGCFGLILLLLAVISLFSASSYLLFLLGDKPYEAAHLGFYVKQCGFFFVVFCTCSMALIAVYKYLRRERIAG